MGVREETPCETEMQQMYKEPRSKRATRSSKREDIRQDIQEDSRAGDREANNRTLSHDSENECQDIVEESASSEMKEQAAHIIRVGDIGTPATLGSFVLIDRKSRMTVTKLD
jgi:hypothetical protein